MLYFVEVRHVGGELAVRMTEMRTWLDHNGIVPESFEHSSGGPGGAFRIGFKAEEHATDFAEAFSGRLEWRDPHGAAVWPSASARKDPEGSR